MIYSDEALWHNIQLNFTGYFIRIYIFEVKTRLAASGVVYFSWDG